MADQQPDEKRTQPEANDTVLAKPEALTSTPPQSRFVPDADAAKLLVRYAASQSVGLLG